MIVRTYASAPPGRSTRVPPRYGYQVALAAFWPRTVTSEPAAEELPLVGLAVRPGVPVLAAAAGRLRDLARAAAAEHGDVKPDWIVAVRTTLARALAAAGAGSLAPGADPDAPVYLVLAGGRFRAADGPDGYLYAVVGAGTFSGYPQRVSGQRPAVPLSTLGPLAVLAGGQPGRQQ